mgnify:CR=1 FL=1
MYVNVHSGRTVESSPLHNHPRDAENRLMRQAVTNTCKQTAANDMFERPSKIMCQEMSGAALEVLTEDDRVQPNTKIDLQCQGKTLITIAEIFRRSHTYII